MKYLFPILLIGTLLFLQNCNSSKYTPDDYPDGQIIFGSGGGFAGLYHHYYVFENGQIFKNSSDNAAYQKVKTIKKSQVKQLFNNYETFGLEQISLNDPGNLTYYLHFKKDAIDKKLTWGGNNEEVPNNVKTTYQILNNLIKE